MKKKGLWFTVGLLIALTLSGCSQQQKQSPQVSEPVQANWWDKWGKPQYGGTLTFRAGKLDLITDPSNPRSSPYGAWLETLFADDMTLDRKNYSFSTEFKPAEYVTGWLAKGWKLTDPLTYTVQTRDGVHWQDKKPTNGREFTAYDVEYSYDKLLGTGHGFTKPDPTYGPMLANLKRVVATDKYTVEFRLKSPNPVAIFEVVGPYLAVGMRPHEYDELSEEEKKDWRNVTGTGAYMISDYVPNTSLKATRNPNYWGHDERHPENKLPYLDEIVYLSIPDMTTAIAALRTGKIDILADAREYPSVAQTEIIAKNNPDVQQYRWSTWGPNVMFKYGVKPFDDIRVRKALQMTIDRKSIAESYYKGHADGLPVGMLDPKVGESWATPYDQWPEKLREEYSYNPAKAKQLLAEAGYPNGFKTNIIASASDDIQLLQIIKSNFMEIGVDMDIEVKDAATFRGISAKLSYDQMTFDAGLGQSTPPTSALSNWWGGNPARGRWGQVSDPEFDAIVEKYNSATTLSESQQYFKEADMYVLNHHWAVGVSMVSSPQFAQSWVKGWDGEKFWSIWQRKYQAQMWIDKKK